MALGLDLAELSRHLRQERLFVTSEREQLQNLYEQVIICYLSDIMGKLFI
jgi:hypothetical protein